MCRPGRIEGFRTTVAEQLKSALSDKREKIDAEVEVLNNQLTPLSEAIHALERAASL